MKQYCRYCIHCCVGNGNWCDVREKEYSDSYFCRVNNCKDFEFCSVDVYDAEHEYKPRDARVKKKKGMKVEKVSIFSQEKEVHE